MNQIPRCDFCHDKRRAVWLYPARPFVMASAAWGSDGAWAACEECSQLIEAGKNETMIDERMLPSVAATMMGRRIYHQFDRETKEQVRKEVRKLFNKFRHARTGGRRLIPDDGSFVQRGSRMAS